MHRRWVLLAAGGLTVAGAAVALALFQPWKLWVDDTVEQAAPVGAVPIPAVTTTTTTTATTTTLPPTTTTTLPPVPAGGEFVGIDHAPREGAFDDDDVDRPPTGR